MSHDLEIANLETFANADGLNPVQRALLKQVAQRLEWCDETIFNAEQRNRELTRRAEQLLAMVDAAQRLAEEWRAIADDVGSNDGYGEQYADMSDELIVALTAPSSSSDPGRADTGREET